MHKDINVKKLVASTLSNYGVSEVTEASVKSMIAGEGYTVIRFSSTEATSETRRLLEALYLDEISTYENSFTYNDRERCIVFVRREIPEDEFLYLLALELGRIKIFSTSADGLIGTTAEEVHLANEFAHHLIDIKNHGLIYNFFKCYPIQFAVCVTAFILCICFVASFFIVKSLSESDGLFDENNSVTSQSGAVNAVSAGSSQLQSANNALLQDGLMSATPTDYVATPSGSKYHTEDCSHVSGKSVKLVTAEDIQNGRYTPCSKCIE